MKAHLYLNECSFDYIATCNEVAKNWVSDLVHIIIELIRRGTDRRLCHPSDISSKRVGPNYDIQTWLKDNRIDIEKRRYLKSLLTKTPFFEENDVTKEIAGFESSYNGARSIGLGLACLNKGISVSLLSANLWDRENLEIQISSLNDSCEIVTKIESVKNAASMDHVIIHGNWLYHNLLNIVQENGCIDEHFSCLFPSIALCRYAYKQMKQLHTTDAHFKQILKIFERLQNYASSWTTGPFDHTQVGCDISVESKVTLQKHSTERTFLGPDGQSILFSWHVKFNPGAWRMYFIPDEVKRSFIVGYIGEHLPIANES